MRIQIVHSLLLATFISIANADSGLDSKALTSLIRRADVLLGARQFSEAINTYSEAIEQAPSDYVLYFKRATAYMTSNRHSSALGDLDTVLKLTDGRYEKALLMKAKVLAGDADWSSAKKLLKQYSKKGDTSKEKDVQDLTFAIAEGEVAMQKAQKAWKGSKYDECVEQATTALMTAAHSSDLRQLRANCSLASGDLEQALGDLTRLTHLRKTSADDYLRIVNISYHLLEPNAQALQTVKQCLRDDPDSKPCRSAHKSLKNLDKEFAKLEKFDESSSWASLGKFVAGSPGDREQGFAARYEAALDAATGAVLGLPQSISPRARSRRRLRIYGLACKAYVKNGQILKASEWCDETLKLDENNIDALVGRAESKLKDEEWEEAVQAFEKAFEASGRSSQEINQKLERAKRLLKQSKQKDYYKILGVARDADAKAIKKAFRKASKIAHPDKGGSEAKMAAVNEAYEVLSKPELRARFDNGEDPNDPQSGQGSPFTHFQGGGHPFQQMFFQQPGGGFQFTWSSG